MEAKDLIRRYSAGERDFAGATLSGADLREADLSGATLDVVWMDRADLRGGRLPHKLLNCSLARAQLDPRDRGDLEREPRPATTRRRPGQEAAFHLVQGRERQLQCQRTEGRDVEARPGDTGPAECPKQLPSGPHRAANHELPGQGGGPLVAGKLLQKAGRRGVWTGHGEGGGGSGGRPPT